MDDDHKIHDESSITLQGKLPEESGNLKGVVRLSSLYGDFQIESSFMIPDGAVVQFSCPYCQEDLTSSRMCEECDAPMVALEMVGGGNIQFCAKRGCKKHWIEFEDPEKELAAFYNKYQPYME